MKIQVRYFASLREALGGQETVDVPEGATLGQLRDHLLARGGRHAEVLSRHRAVRGAVNQRMVGEDEAVAEGAEVAFFPPVTGG